MIKINRSMLEQSRVSGGASKPAGYDCPVDSTTNTQSVSSSTKVVINGQTVVDKTVTI